MKPRGFKSTKKKPFALIKTIDHFDKEIGGQAILDALDQATNKMNQELEKLDLAEAVRVATFLVKKAGFEMDTGQALSFDKIKPEIVQTFRLTTTRVIQTRNMTLLTRAIHSYAL